jgi:hypothetical protein
MVAISCDRLIILLLNFYSKGKGSLALPVTMGWLAWASFILRLNTKDFLQSIPLLMTNHGRNLFLTTY